MMVAYFINTVFVALITGLTLGVSSADSSGERTCALVMWVATWATFFLLGGGIAP